VFHYQTAQTTEQLKKSQDYYYSLYCIMTQLHNALLLQHEGRLQLALQAYNSGQFWSYQTAAHAYNIKQRVLSSRARGITSCVETLSNCQKLTATEEQTIVQYILDLNSRGFVLQLCKVADMADKLLVARSSEPVDKHWAERFVTRSAELKITFNQAKDRQRILQEDSAVIGVWFKLVEETKAK
jgi:hypothetical protein